MEPLIFPVIHNLLNILCHILSLYVCFLHFSSTFQFPSIEFSNSQYESNLNKTFIVA